MRRSSSVQGHSAAAAVAYRAGLDLTDERTGDAKRYSRRETRGDVIGSGIIGDHVAPGDFGAWAAAVESAEKRKNSRLLRDVQVSLPAELDTRQQEELLRRIAADVAARYETTATWHHHRADRRGDRRNQHGHILLATRQIGKDGFGKKLRRLDDMKTGPEEITAIRQIFADRTNKALEAAGRPERITAVRDPDAEPELPPQPTLGAAVTAVERRAAAERRGADLDGQSPRADSRRRRRDRVRAPLGRLRRPT